MIMLKVAEKYEELLALLGYRPHPMRLLVLRTLCEHTELTDIHGLAAHMTAAGIALEKEKVRMILKRLNESGFLDRQGIPGQNKFLFRLKPYDELYADVQLRINSKHQ